MYVGHAETTTISPINTSLVAVIDVALLIWLLYIYLRVLPTKVGGSVFPSVQGFVLLTAASFALWALLISVIIGLPARLCLIFFSESNSYNIYKCQFLCFTYISLLLIWLLYIYFRFLPKVGSVFASVQGFVLLTAASVALWMLMISAIIGLPARLCLISIDIFTDDICVYFMITSQGKQWYLTFCGGCHRCIAKICFGGQGVSGDEDDEREYHQAVSEEEQKNVLSTEESVSGGTVSSDAQLL